MLKFRSVFFHLWPLHPKHRPKFVLNLGAQKSGTSWLHGTLKKHQNCELGLLKEYHIWDQWVPQEILGYDFNSAASWIDDAQQMLRQKMLQDEEYYFNYFKNLISPAVRVTGDFTPNYSLLDKEKLQHLSWKLMDVGFDVVVVFLMRDPVDRCWSAFRSHYRDLDRELPTEELIEKFRAFYTSPQTVARTRYDEIIPKLQSLETSKAPDGSKGDVSVVLQSYEQMMKGDVHTLANALSLGAETLINSQVYNASPIQSLPENEIAECASFFAQTYAYCAAHHTDIAQHWRRTV